MSGAPDGEAAPERTPLSSFGLVRRIWQYCRSRRFLVAATLAACALETTFYWLVPLSFRALIDGALTAPDRGRLTLILTCLVTGAAVASIASFQRGRWWAHLQNQVVSDLRFQVYTKIQTLSPEFLSKRRTAEVLAHFSHDITAVDQVLTMAVTWGLLPGLDSCVGTLVLFVLDWRLALVAVLVWPWCALAPARLAPRAIRGSLLRKETEASVFDAVEQAIAGHRVVRAYNLEEEATRDFLMRDAALFATSVRLSVAKTMMDQTATVGLLLLQVATLAAGAWMVFQGSMTVGTLAAFQALHLSVSNSMLYFLEFTRSLMPARASMHRIDQFLGTGAALADRPGAPPMAPFAQAIEFRGVSLAHGRRTALDHLTLTVERGTFVGIVGASGSGKSSVLDLLLRLRDPSSGAIVVDGVDLRDRQQRSWRAQIGIVFQENFLFNTTFRENIRLGWAAATDAEVAAAAAAAEIHDFILSQPRGYDTEVGERGGQLSGGERQRVALARAIVRNPRILVLDEATSALDPETEAAITRTLMRVARDRTVIAVTHRLASVAQADRVFVLDRGRLVEEGPPDVLLARGGAYAAMWQRQRLAGVGQGSEASLT